ncbi:MAG TPA: D-alanine--D-alanine ligase [Tepidisphaeraceae bacterium]
MKVTVLFGGPSAEREVSLVSGRSVIEGLKTAGHEVFPSDVSPTDLSGLQRPTDVIFPVLHGSFGESGELQEILEQRGLTFVGSGSIASRTGMNKDRSKRMWQRAGLPTAPHEVIGAPTDISAAVGRIGTPCVVKPVDSGSSIDVFICRSAPDAAKACEQVFARHAAVMVEKFLKGIELTIGMLEERILPPLRISTSREFFDYQAKYVGNSATHHFDLNLPADVVTKVKQIALQANQTVGCRDLSRLDVIVDEQHRPWILEVNTIPGFTPKSLLPEMAAHDGIPFPKLVDRLVCRAFQRGSANKRAAV